MTTQLKFESSLSSKCRSINSFANLFKYWITSVCGNLLQLLLLPLKTVLSDLKKGINNNRNLIQNNIKT